MDAYTQLPTINNPPANIQELSQELHRVFDSDKVNIDYVKALMTSYSSSCNDWQQFAKFDPYR